MVCSCGKLIPENKQQCLACEEALQLERLKKATAISWRTEVNALLRDDQSRETCQLVLNWLENPLQVWDRKGIWEFTDTELAEFTHAIDGALTLLKNYCQARGIIKIRTGEQKQKEAAAEQAKEIKARKEKLLNQRAEKVVSSDNGDAKIKLKRELGKGLPEKHRKLISFVIDHKLDIPNFGTLKFEQLLNAVQEAIKV